MTITKGEMILTILEDVVKSGEFKTRKEIANEVGCTVSRVSEILTKYNDSNVVAGYRALDMFIKMQDELIAA